MADSFVLLAALISVALIFDFLNGLHDAANSIATVVSTGVLKPGQAVVFAAFFNLVAIFVFHLSVAATVGKGIIAPEFVDAGVIFGALVGAIAWNLITWYYGLPTSSSHALIGGYAGGAVAHAGMGVIIPGGWTKTLIFIVLAPTIGLLLGLILMTAIYWLFRDMGPSRVDRLFRRLQLVSAALYSLGHGANDAQKTMGIMAALLYAGGYLALRPDGTLEIDWWIPLLAYSAIAAGTIWGGWKIIETMGLRITLLRPSSGLAANVGAVTAIFGATARAACDSATSASGVKAKRRSRISDARASEPIPKPASRKK